MDNLKKKLKELKQAIKENNTLIVESKTQQSLKNISSVVSKKRKANVPTNSIKFLDLLVNLNIEYPLDFCLCTKNHTSFMQAMKIYYDTKLKLPFDSKPNKMYDFIVYDKFIPVGDKNKIEKVNKQLIPEIAKLLLHMKKGGCFVTKMYTMYEKETQEFLVELSKSFESVKIVKPVGSSPWNSEKYVVCKNYGVQGKPKTTKQIKKINSLFVEDQCEMIDRLIKGTSPKYNFKFKNFN